MRFWDSSALTTLFLPEPASYRVEDLLSRDARIAIWWATPVECLGAVARAKRGGRFADSSIRKAKALLDFVLANAFEVEPNAEIRDQARRLVVIHSLRAADALQLAASLEWCGGNTNGESFVCLDDRLRGAATLEGFRVLPYSEEVNEARVEYMAV